MEKHLEYQELYHNFIDYKKALDPVWREGMGKMRGCGVVISQMRGCDLRGFLGGVIGKMQGYSKPVLLQLLAA